MLTEAQPQTLKWYFRGEVGIVRYSVALHMDWMVSFPIRWTRASEVYECAFTEWHRYLGLPSKTSDLRSA